MITSGTKLWFEYHCWESDESADAELWHHSHQLVVVGECNNPENEEEFPTYEERCEVGMPLIYYITFGDGFKGAAFEDELLNSPEEYIRPDPPTRSNYVKKG